MTTLVLASGSSIRAHLMRAAGLRFVIQPADLDERRLAEKWVADGGAPEDVAAPLAMAKAAAVSTVRPDDWVIGGDQILIDPAGAVLSKAADLGEARRRLLAFSGRTHRLRGAAAILRDGELVDATISDVDVTLRPLTEADVDAYLRRAGEGILRSVACYEIEALGLQLIARIDGDHFSALGLPMLWLLEALRRAGAPLD